MKQELTDEQKRVAIAEACGWHFETQSGRFHFYAPDGFTQGWSTTSALEAINYAKVPDYLGSLDAMHEALCTLKTDGSWGRYRKAIESIVGHHFGSETVDWFMEHNATARQRADAFLASLPVHQPKPEKI